MLHLILGHGSAQKIAYHKARAVAVGENKYPARRGNPANQAELLAVLKDAEAVGFDNRRVDDTSQLDFVVTTLNDHRFLKRHRLPSLAVRSS